MALSSASHFAPSPASRRFELLIGLDFAELNSRLTEFLSAESRVMDREQFIAEYPFTP